MFFNSKSMCFSDSVHLDFESRLSADFFGSPRWPTVVDHRGLVHNKVRSVMWRQTLRLCQSASGTTLTHQHTNTKLRVFERGPGTADVNLTSLHVKQCVAWSVRIGCGASGAKCVVTSHALKGIEQHTTHNTTTTQPQHNKTTIIQPGEAPFKQARSLESCSLRRWPNTIPAFPPYGVRTPHLHGLPTTEKK